MQQIECYLHPKTEHISATTICENCQQPICPIHQRKNRVYGGIDEADNVYEYCTSCYDQITQQQQEYMTSGAGGELINNVVNFQKVFLGIFIIFSIFIFYFFYTIMQKFP